MMLRSRVRHLQVWVWYISLTGLEYVIKYASKEAADEAGADTEDDDDMSSVGSFGDEEDEEPAGTMEEV